MSQRHTTESGHTAATPWSWLHQSHPEAAHRLDELYAAAGLNDVDYLRIVAELQRASANPTQLQQLAHDIVEYGHRAAPHFSGLTQLPTDTFAAHNLRAGAVRLGSIVPRPNTDHINSTQFGIDSRSLTTSLLAIGPPGSGKTRSIAIPIVESLSLQALANTASLVVLDPKNTDFDYPGWFDHTIDLASPSSGLSLFGGAPDAEIAADRLASALLPVGVSADKAYFMDASYNALYSCLAPFREAHQRWPHVRELLALLRCEQAAVDQVKQHLKGPEAKEMKRLLDTRKAQATGRVDPAASIVERLSLLDRPALRKVLDHPEPFEMQSINTPIRVRIAISETQYPEASRILARLVVSQFVQVCGSPSANRDIFKGLIIDEAGRYIDDYVARGVQRLRSNNAGMVLLTQSLSDFPSDILPTVFGSVGCKAVFGGVNPSDAEQFSKWFGDHWQNIVSTKIGQSQSQGRTSGTSIGSSMRGVMNSSMSGTSTSSSVDSGVTTTPYERARWSPSDITTGIPFGHALIGLATYDGQRVGPVLVNLRG